MDISVALDPRTLLLVELRARRYTLLSRGYALVCAANSYASAVRCARLITRVRVYSLPRVSIYACVLVGRANCRGGPARRGTPRVC